MRHYPTITYDKLKFLLAQRQSLCISRKAGKNVFEIVKIIEQSCTRDSFIRSAYLNFDFAVTYK